MNMQSEESGFYDTTGPGKPRPITKAEALGEGVEEAATAAGGECEAEQPVETEEQERERLTRRVLDAWDAGEFDDAEAVDAVEQYFRMKDGSIDFASADMETLRWMVGLLPASQVDTEGADEDKDVEANADDVEASTDEASDEGDDNAESEDTKDAKETEDRGLYGGTIEDVSKAIATEHGLELMSQRLRKALYRKLTDHELAERAGELAEIIKRRSNIDEEKKARVRHANERLKDLDEQIAALAEPIRVGSDTVTVDCCVCADFAANEVRVFRLDTRDVAETRAMTAQERERLAQPGLPFDGPANVGATATDAVEPDPDAPPALEQGQRLAATRPDPAELSATGLVTAGCAEHATYIGPHTTDDGRRFATYKLDGGNRHAFVPWPEPEGIVDVEADDAETSDDGAPDNEAAVLDAELGDYSFDDDESNAEPPHAERWRGTDPALVEKARTNLTGVTPAVPK